MERYTLALCLALVALAGHPSLAQQDPPAPVPPTPPGRIEVAFVLDTTGSMGGLIALAKQKIWAILSAMNAAEPGPDLRVGLVAYRDRGEEYVTKVADLTADLDTAHLSLTSYTAAGGHNMPAVHQALNEAVTRLSWSKDATTYKVIFLVGDYPPYDYQGDVMYPDTCKLAAAANITINTIRCGYYEPAVAPWQEIARLAEGKYFHISQTGGPSVVATPFDDKLSALTDKLDATRMYYGIPEARAAHEKRDTDYEALKGGATATDKAERGAFYADPKGYKAYVTRAELLSAVEDGAVKLADIKDEHLPDALRALTKDDREKFIAEQIALRKAVRDEMAEVARKREEWRAAEIRRLEAAAAQRSFEYVVFQAVREQAGKRGIIYPSDIPAPRPSAGVPPPAA